MISVTTDRSALRRALAPLGCFALALVIACVTPTTSTPAAADPENAAESDPADNPDLDRPAAPGHSNDVSAATHAPSVGEKQAVGAKCLQSEDCESGICEGMGCEDDQPGQCAAKQRPCTYDLVAYCGCDDQTFETSSVCAGRRYAHTGRCEDTNAK